ncbi:MAG: hydroxyethylthiazole kinase [Dethiobacter sp.]|jgi:hydroxyethylthiazole kinase|nr:hydroxyethylthiazole kinase [Dethiobacter sp.]
MSGLIDLIAEALVRVRVKRPLVHHITNFVVMNDCANITLHIGGSPVMAHDREEVEEMVSLADSLLLNIGTLSGDRIDSMVLAGRCANKKAIPVLLDPVGAGATVMRSQAAKRLLREVKISFIKGNAGEISVLAGEDAAVRGVDFAETSGDLAKVACRLAKEYNCTVIITGAVDWVSDGQSTYSVQNGHKLMSALTGTGCMAGSLVAAFAGAVEDPMLAALSGLTCFGIAAELAAKREQNPASFKTALFDEVYALNSEKIKMLARFERVS